MHLSRIVIGLAALLAPLAAAVRARDIIDRSDLVEYKIFRDHLPQDQRTKMSFVQAGRGSNFIRVDVYSSSGNSPQWQYFRLFKARENAQRILNPGHRRSIEIPQQE
ncbi:uncharacterized protein UV8b_07598 [Ustilaginoidea virens]|uniref:Uncharacterized protein n=1 Tax=Ustilaginoidea virens TaxID=1159556 RepID=A0A8E5MKP1_USTVR|nr:uncharacterized protein UV8b_07598 [Ustilaginoidea virens]QUC23357.1 hypothetical protein UV8b_07598 [Ustilaginoidea virens]